MLGASFSASARICSTRRLVAGWRSSMAPSRSRVICTRYGISARRFGSTGNVCSPSAASRRRGGMQRAEELADADSERRSLRVREACIRRLDAGQQSMAEERAREELALRSDECGDRHGSRKQRSDARKHGDFARDERHRDRATAGSEMPTARRPPTRSCRTPPPRALPSGRGARETARSGARARVTRRSRRLRPTRASRHRTPTDRHDVRPGALL